LRKVVLSLGGSVLIRGDKDPSYLRSLSRALLSAPPDHRFVIVTGGGRLAREYIGIGRELGADESTLDEIGIEATRLNAWLILSVLGREANPVPFRRLDDALSLTSAHRFVVGGGLHPGQTTDAVSAIVAERWGADMFINMTAVPGAFTSDPLKDPKARRIPRMTSKELLDLVSDVRSEAGSHSVMDPLASRIIARSGLPTYIIDGRDLRSFKGVLQGRAYKGTIVIPDRRKV
jgi:uridylate kinase